MQKQPDGLGVGLLDMILYVEFQQINQSVIISMPICSVSLSIAPIACATR